MNDAEKELLISYIESNVAPILVDFIDGSSIPNSVVLPANLEITELNGHYDNDKWVAVSSCYLGYERIQKKAPILLRNINNILMEEDSCSNPISYDVEFDALFK